MVAWLNRMTSRTITIRLGFSFITNTIIIIGRKIIKITARVVVHFACEIKVRDPMICSKLRHIGPVSHVG
jgi:hypothetical protein